ncbi:minor tail protein [Gordonia phage PhorbesPhlower]|nr:minor tail protein [Gordonia phage PhorbesPhlower]UUG69878.1 minor tail protein [Gordonia phage Morkie]
MGVLELAEIELVADDDSMVVSGGGFDIRHIKLSSDPDDLFSDELELKIIETAYAPGGMDGGNTYPVRELVLPFNLYDTGQGIEATISRFRKMWRPGRSIEWRVTTHLSGLRWLHLRRSAGIKFSPKQDWNLDGCVRATVTATALQPNYESPPMEVLLTNPTSGTNTLWAPAWNPTDQKCWPEWSLKPGSSATKFSFADFSFGNEQEIDVTWTPGQHANRMIVTDPISTMWSVMSDPVMDTYVASDLSNASGQMGGVEPLYWIPPYTGSPEDPVLLPVTITGPAGAQAKLTLRRFWSAESGLE